MINGTIRLDLTSYSALRYLEMIRKPLIGLALAVAGFGATPAFSATTFGVTITGVGCDANGVCFANISPAANVAGGSAACPNQAQVRWDGLSAEGKNWTASALTAKAGELTVNIGTVDDQCTGGATMDQFPVLNFMTVAG